MSTPNGRRQLLIALTALVWAAAIAASIGRFKMSARRFVTVHLTTTPRTVSVSVNNRNPFNSKYVTTPQTLKLPPGVAKIRISRDGYTTNVVEVQGDSGDVFKMDQVALGRDPQTLPGHVDITATDREDLFVDIGDGLLAGRPPLSEQDLVGGATYTLTVYQDSAAGDVLLRCRFTPPANDEDDDNQTARKKIMRIVLKGSPLKAAGCQRLRSKNATGRIE